MSKLKSGKSAASEMLAELRKLTASFQDLETRPPGEVSWKSGTILKKNTEEILAIKQQYIKLKPYKEPTNKEREAQELS